MNSNPSPTAANLSNVPEQSNQLGIYGIAFSLFIAIVAELIFKTHLISEIELTAAVRVIVVFLSLYSLHRFSAIAFKGYDVSLKNLLTFALVLLGSLMVVWFGRIISLSLSSYTLDTGFLAGVKPESLFFCIPYASGALLIQSVLGLQFAAVFSISLGLVLGVYTPDAFFLPMILATCLVASLSLSRCRTRSAYLKAGLNISLICIPFALASIIVEPDIVIIDIVTRISGSILSGVLCAFVAAGVTPVLEYVGGYVTDMRLLEMATLDHPLLKELSIQAPGTWNHSMVIGMMVEAASDEVGANPILARVSAYYHDIGKMKKPLYFVENQGRGENRHDKLSSSMSALIIKSHVKDGIELAKKHKLPKAIEDMIPQHHGTSRIQFFYDKARKEAEEAGEDPDSIDESLYCYPGPKPQTREAGILMLADGIEAAARTLSDPSHDRIQGLVQKLINKVFSSGQLNECELTLKDLHLIAKSFTRVLTGIYHQRVAYTVPAEKVNDKQGEDEKVVLKKVESEANDSDKKVSKKKAASKKKVGSGSSSEGAGEEDKSEGDSKSRKEDLKRLGM